MNRYLKIICFLIMCFIVVACNVKDKPVNITKNGSSIEYSNVEFTYPNTFKQKDETIAKENSVQSQIVEQDKIELVKDDSSILLTIDPILSQNKEEELIQLFRVEVETTGATIISNAKVKLDNGDSCYEIVSKNDTEQAKYLVVFEEGKRYSLKYKTLQENYDKNILDMDKFLYTFTVKESGEQVD